MFVLQYLAIIVAVGILAAAVLFVYAITWMTDDMLEEHESRRVRVWPDGTEQDVEDGEPYAWMSDDYEIVDRS